MQHAFATFIMNHYYNNVIVIMTSTFDFQRVTRPKNLL